ncbi:DNA polymerase III subunit delta' [Domibacillus epiphyticus]|uniref:DNA polymerase III subunit delta' n=1 Tax=Domibacillus epiphyticus TaxID=1714355 RepID=A0A1V2A7R1_9BACI|nr:DNA polymerase III subunit delta' [Domibacillus epiphyticus]OMP66854.1 DNA polymerase III subunit delta' [Domibacillus epiphyticus]
MSKPWEESARRQPIVMRMIENSILKDRVAHAYLLEGDPGTGKKEIAFLFAKSLFCLEPVNRLIPCDSCVNCRRIGHGNHPDLHVIEPDGLSIKKEQIYHLQQEFTKTAVESSRKIYIVNHADKMTASAANSLLKFLEEPASDTVAFLLTEQSSRMLPTILSRCQHLSFRPIDAGQLKDRLIQENVPIPIASLASKMTNHLDEALEFSGDEWFAQARLIVLKLYEVIGQGGLTAIVQLSEDFHSHFKEKQQVSLALDLFVLIHRDLLSIMTGEEHGLAFPDRLASFRQDALHLSAEALADRLACILEAKRRLNSNMNQQLLMEQLLLKLQGGHAFV